MRFGGLALLGSLLAMSLAAPSVLADTPTPLEPTTCRSHHQIVTATASFIVQTPQGASTGAGDWTQEKIITRCTTLDTLCPTGWYEVRVHSAGLDMDGLARLTAHSDIAYQYVFDCTTEADARHRAERTQTFTGIGEGLVHGRSVSGPAAATGGHLQRMFTPYGFTFVDATKGITVTGTGFA